MPNYRKVAFTIFELLVVVLILSILVSLLLPVLSKAKNKAKTTVNLSNLRQLGVASEIYASDHPYFVPRLHHDLISEGVFTKALCDSGADSRPEGIANWLRFSSYKLMKQPILVLPVDYKDSVVALADYVGIDSASSQHRDKKNSGWAVMFGDHEPQTLGPYVSYVRGTFHRLRYDGSIITRFSDEEPSDDPRYVSKYRPALLFRDDE